MSDPSSQEYRNIKALVTIFGELDDLVIEASREACRRSTAVIPITEGNLCTLEGSRQDYYNSNYGMVEILRFLDKMSNLKPIWHSAMLTIIKSGSWAIIEKFALLDDTLDPLLPSFGISSQRQRLSDELRDTL